MGLYNRDYGREYGEETPWDRQMRSQQNKSMTVILIAVTFAFFVVDLFLPSTLEGESSLSWMGRYLSVNQDTMLKPWMWWKCLTYGFVHDSNSIMHLAFNMFALFVFGRKVEEALGRDEYLRFYLLRILFGGIVGAAGFWFNGTQLAILVGASGGVMAVTLLFACKFPHDTLLLFMVFPMKAWVLAVVVIIFNLLGAAGISSSAAPGEANTAFGVHLAGIAFGLAYHYGGLNFRWLDLGWITNGPTKLRQSWRRTKLKVHDPDRKMRDDAHAADDILAKIEKHGEQSLSASERKTLERYSKRLRKQREN